MPLYENEGKILYQLLEISRNHPLCLARVVAQDIIQQNDFIEYVTEILVHHCAFGKVKSLSNYIDIYKFYDTHYLEIEAIRMEYETAFNEPFVPDGNLKTWYVFFTYTHIIELIAIELNLEW